MKQLIKELLEDDEFHKAISDIVSEAIDTKLAELKTDIEKKNGTIHDILCKQDESKKKVKKLEEQLKSSANDISKLTFDFNNQEQYSRRNCVRVYGIKESQNENTDSLVCQMAKEKLKIDLQPHHIDRSHQIGNKKIPRKLVDVFLLDQSS